MSIIYKGRGYSRWSLNNGVVDCAKKFGPMLNIEIKLFTYESKIQIHNILLEELKKNGYGDCLNESGLIKPECGNERIWLFNLINKKIYKNDSGIKLREVMSNLISRPWMVIIPKDFSKASPEVVERPLFVSKKMRYFKCLWKEWGRMGFIDMYSPFYFNSNSKLKPLDFIHDSKSIVQPIFNWFYTFLKENDVGLAVPSNSITIIKLREFSVNIRGEFINPSSLNFDYREYGQRVYPLDYIRHSSLPPLPPPRLPLPPPSTGGGASAASVAGGGGAAPVRGTSGGTDVSITSTEKTAADALISLAGKKRPRE